MISHVCEFCGQAVEGEDLRGFGDAYIAHIRETHQEMPFPDEAIRNYAEATQRLTGSTDRLDEIGAVEIHRVTEDRIADWLAFFDHDVFADNPAWAACYCAEPHVYPRDANPEDVPPRTWHQNRETTTDLLRSGRCVGYLAYVDGTPAGWVNASARSEYALYRDGDGGPEPRDNAVCGISCFAIAPPYRRHGLAEQLLARVLEDLPERELEWIEAYPAGEVRDGDAGNFRGTLAMFERNGFVPAEQRERYVVVRRRA